MKYDLIILYAKADINIVSIVTQYLEGNGVKVWKADDGRPYFQLSPSEKIKAIAESEVTMLLFTENSNSDESLESDVDTAFSAGKVCIPFCTTDEPMSMVLNYYLGKTHHVMADYRKGLAFNELLEAVYANVPHLALQQEREKAAKTLLPTLKGFSVDEAASIIKDELTDDAVKEREFEEMLNKFIEELPEPDSQNTDNENAYDLLTNAVGELLLIIKAKKSDPVNPYFVLTDNGLLFFNRNSEGFIKICNLSENLNDLRAQRDILVCEVLNDDVFREYRVRLFHELYEIEE